MAQQLDFELLDLLTDKTKSSKEKVLKDISENDWHYKDIEQLNNVIELAETLEAYMTHVEGVINELIAISSGIALIEEKERLKRLILGINFEAEMWEVNYKHNLNRIMTPKKAEKKYVRNFKEKLNALKNTK